ncbi:mechanosensitive ion channel family protein [Gelidibacter salicanalis]|uniref:Mechanosensitive ion channel n=1 Tax=Gelidibacter salicanalis TaxID=291193 RepID=A0A934NK61_9FLAO|nr:mechanosensitive ion channel domain-containing protein [Gelidibacter salicanalis]MBJ7879377.1 mechanosensitive ion channel [Gelidibacter salicanalis]
MKEIKEFLNLSIHLSDEIVISVRDILILAVVLFVATIILRIVNKIITRNLPLPNKRKVNTVFSYFRYLVYMIILFIMLHSFGVPVTGVFAASAALLLGIGLALQTLFQDIISGVFILVDQTVHVGDIIELDGKIGRVDEIKLRTTRATTVDNKVLIIPNHFYLTNSLYNWTQNGTTTRESVSIGVAYGSDVQLVKKILLEVAKNHPAVLDTPEPSVLFTDFGESSLNFKVAFTLNDSFNVRFPQSDMRFEIDRLFREHNISIPFPQRDIHIIGNPSSSKV